TAPGRSHSLVLVFLAHDGKFGGVREHYSSKGAGGSLSVIKGLTDQGRPEWAFCPTLPLFARNPSRTPRCSSPESRRSRPAGRRRPRPRPPCAPAHPHRA